MRNYLAISFLLMTLLFVLTIANFGALAQTYNVNVDFDNAMCVGDNIRATANVTSNGSLTILTKTEACPFGCDADNQRCNPSPFDALIYYVIGGVVGIFLLILILARLTR